MAESLVTTVSFYSPTQGGSVRWQMVIDQARNRIYLRDSFEMISLNTQTQETSRYTFLSGVVATTGPTLALNPANGTLYTGVLVGAVEAVRRYNPEGWVQLNQSAAFFGGLFVAFRFAQGTLHTTTTAGGNLRYRQFEADSLVLMREIVVMGRPGVGMVDVDSTGDVWIACRDPDALLRITPDGTVTTFSVEGAIENPYHLAYDPVSHSLLVSAASGAPGGSTLTRWDIATESVAATQVVGTGTGQENSYMQGPIDGVFWVNYAPYNTTTLEPVGNAITPGTATGTDTATYTRTYGAVYDEDYGTIWFLRGTQNIVHAFVMIRPGCNPVPLKDIVADLYRRAGLTPDDYDVSALETPLIDGYVIKQRMRARDALEPILRYNPEVPVDTVERGPQLVSVKRGQPISVTVPADDLAAHEAGQAVPAAVEPVRTLDDDLPRRVEISYIQADRDYETDQQHAQRPVFPTPTMFSGDPQVISLDLVTTPDGAKHIAEMTLYAAWLERSQLTFNLGPQYSAHEPTDVVALEAGPLHYRVRLVQVDHGASGVLTCEAVVEDLLVVPETFVEVIALSYTTFPTQAEAEAWLTANGYSTAGLVPGDDGWVAPQASPAEGQPGSHTTVTLEAGVTATTWTPDAPAVDAPPVSADPGHPGADTTPYLPPPDTVSPPAPATMVMLDTAIARDLDDDPGFYLGAYSTASGWRGSTVYKSADGVSYTRIAQVGAMVAIGTAGAALADHPHEYWDRAHTLTVTMTVGALYSAAETDVLNGANVALYGHEALQWQDAEEISPHTYRLSGLLRGRKGTEWATGLHGAGERFVVLTSATLKRYAAPLVDLYQARQYKAVSPFAEITTVSAQTLTNTGRGLKPYAPWHVTGRRDDSDNLTISWTRRTRYVGEWIDIADVPLGETAELYEVDILDGATVVRTLTSGQPDIEYGVAEQTADFGSAQASMTVRVYQMSSIVGRGYVAEATV